jgi:hypothetical protein
MEYYSIEFSPDALQKKIAEGGELWRKELKSIVFGQLPEFSEVRRAIREWIRSA